MFFRKRQVNYFILIVLFVATLWLWSALFCQTQTDFLEVHFFDVGQGDSTFIETPAGRQVLIDGGPDATILEKLSQNMPFYDRSIDLVILTHPDADHLTGLVKVLEYYQIDHILTPGLKKETATYQRWQEIIREKDISLTKAQAGQKINFGNGLIMEILWPEQSSLELLANKANNVSVVGQLIYGQSKFLLTGDIEKEIEQRLIKQEESLASDILKVPHHGSKTSSGKSFIEKVNPQISVISVGADNRYGHPHPNVLERLKETAIYRTDQNGDNEILTDGFSFRIIKEK